MKEDGFTLERVTRRAYTPRSFRDTDTVEITDAVSETEKEKAFSIPEKEPADKRFHTSNYSSLGANFSSRKKEEAFTEEEYGLNGTVMRKLKIKCRTGGVSFYEKFASDAERSHKLQGKYAPYVPYFAYIPQYSQLNRAQWEYYLYFKKCTREGVFLPDTDFSYIMLYVYEIINLDRIISPEEGVTALAELWVKYRAVHPILDKYMTEWVADYCMCYRQTLPKQLHKILAEVAPKSSFKEFYADFAFSERENLEAGTVGEILRMIMCDYSPERSRYATKYESFAKDVKTLFVKTVEKQLSRGEGVFSGKNSTDYTVKRDAFAGSLCAKNIRRSFEIFCHSFLRSPEARRILTELMKGCENAVREKYGVKGRLSAPAIRESAEVIPNSEAYLAYYDSTDELSLEAADKIERESWKNTALLTSEIDEDTDVFEKIEGEIGFDDTDINLTAPTFEDVGVNEDVSLSIVATAAVEVPENFGTALKLRKDLHTVLNRTLKGESFTTVCRELGMFSDSAAAEINELAADFIGDVLLERGLSDYEIIDDYRDEIPKLDGGI